MCLHVESNIASGFNVLNYNVDNIERTSKVNKGDFPHVTDLSAADFDRPNEQGQGMILPERLLISSSARTFILNVPGTLHEEPLKVILIVY